MAEIADIVNLALAEDIGSGDVTSQACVPADRRASGVFLARAPLILAGVNLLPMIYEARGGVEELTLLHKDGDRLEEGNVIATVRGSARTLLECERVALNFLQRLAGVATLAHEFATVVQGTKCKVLDTRKTTPGLRRLEKAAAAAGGVTQHPPGPFDVVFFQKKQHPPAAGGVRQAIENVRASGLPIEIEVRALDELNDALASGATHLLLDNLSPQQA